MPASQPLPRPSLLRPLLVVLAAVLLLTAASTAHAAPPPAGVPVQLAPPDACQSSTAAGGCAAFATSSISGAGGLAVADDGRDVYAVGDNGGGVALSRDAATGALTAIGPAAFGTAVAAAPDGNGVFVGFRDTGSDNGGVEAYRRGATGLLTFQNQILDSCAVGVFCATDNGLYDVEGIAVAPDSATIYAASHAGGGDGADVNSTGDGAITVFSRNPATQAITLVQCQPNSTGGGWCNAGGVTGLRGAEGLAVTPDGKFLYVASRFDSAVVGFNLVASGPNKGKIGSPVNCLWAAASNIDCSQTAGLTSAAGLTISPDGRDIYVASFSGGVTALRRDPVSGVISFTQCFNQSGSGTCDADAALVAGARNVDVSPDGRFVYATGGGGTDGFLRAYARDATTGRLAPLGCVTHLAITGCATGAGLKNAENVAVTADGRNLYTTAFQGGDGNGAVAAFRIEAAPSCQDATAAVAAVAAGASVSLPLTCTDADGDALTRTISGAPAHGSLGAIDDAAGAVTYSAAANAPSGADTVRYTASDGTNPSAEATITITVTATPTATPPAAPAVPAARDTIAPRSRITSPHRTIRRTKLTTLRGTASDNVGVTRVDISLVRLVGGARIARAGCRVLTTRGALRTASAKKGRCSATGFLKAAGTTRWSLRLKHKLPRGSYVLTARATDAARNVERGQTVARGDRLAFTVK